LPWILIAVTQWLRVLLHHQRSTLNVAFAIAFSVMAAAYVVTAVAGPMGTLSDRRLTGPPVVIDERPQKGWDGSVHEAVDDALSRVQLTCSSLQRGVRGCSPATDRSLSEAFSHTDRSGDRASGWRWRRHAGIHPPGHLQTTVNCSTTRSLNVAGERKPVK